MLTVDNVDSILLLTPAVKRGVLKATLLDDDIYISFDNKKIKKSPAINVLLKMSNLNLLTKASFFDYGKNENLINGNILIKKDKGKFNGIFQYKDNAIQFKNSNLTNSFLDGKLIGEIVFLPYFNFNLDINLNSINFTSLYNHFLALNKKENLFKINKKINGKLSLASDRIYSSYNIVKSFESPNKIQ